MPAWTSILWLNLWELKSVRVWGLGGGVMEVDGHKAFAMGGDNIGYHAFFIGTLDGKFIVTALVNTDIGNVISTSITALKQNMSQQVESK